MQFIGDHFLFSAGYNLLQIWNIVVIILFDDCNNFRL